MDRNLTLILIFIYFIFFTFISYYFLKIKLFSSVILGLLIALIALIVYYPPQNLALDEMNLGFLIYILFFVMSIILIIIYVIMKSLCDCRIDCK